MGRHHCTAQQPRPIPERDSQGSQPTKKHIPEARKGDLYLMKLFYCICNFHYLVLELTGLERDEKKVFMKNPSRFKTMDRILGISCKSYLRETKYMQRI